MRTFGLKVKSYSLTVSLSLELFLVSVNSKGETLLFGYWC